MKTILAALTLSALVSGLAAADTKAPSVDDIKASMPVDNPDDFVPIGGGIEANDFCQIFRDGDPNAFCCFQSADEICCSRGGLEWHCSANGGLPPGQP